MLPIEYTNLIEQSLNVSIGVFIGIMFAILIYYLIKRELPTIF